MIDKLFPGLYKFVIPLPGNPLKAVNSYFIKGEGRNLLIDTGINRPECRKAFDQALRELDVDLQKTDILMTHFHADHAGLISYLHSPDSRVYASQNDSEILTSFLGSNRTQYWNDLADYAVQNGFLEGKQDIISHPGYKYSKPGDIEFEILEDGMNIEVAGFSLKCILTPGHTQGHLCLYDEEKQIFFSGDHILAEITPNIALFSGHYNPLQDYLQSLDKVFNLAVKLTLPGHGSIIYNHQERIMKLKEHHRLRCEEILGILVYGPANAYNIASMMNWDLKYYQWDEFPLPQKWFATGETIAHLKYLSENGQVLQYDCDGVTLFSHI